MSSSTNSRLIEVDTVRGALLVLMTMVHLPGVVGRHLADILGVVGSAEGFVLASGFMAGIVGTRKLKRKGTRVLYRDFFRRALMIYAAHVGAIFSLLVVAAFILEFRIQWQAFGLAIGSGLKHLFPPTILLLHQPRYLDILPLFMGLILLAPFLVEQLVIGRVQTVLAVSLSCWMLAQVAGPALSSQLVGIMFPTTVYYNESDFVFLAWQLLFVIGLVIGERWENGKELLSFSRAGVLVAACFISFCLLWRHQWVSIALPSEVVVFLVGKLRLGPLRIFEALAAFYLLCQLARRFPAIFRIRPLAYLGRRSLAVFIAHAFILYLTIGVRDRWDQDWSVELQLLATAGVVTLLVAAAMAWSGVGEMLKTRKVKCHVKDRISIVSASNE